MGGIALSVFAAAVLVLFPAMARRWGLWLAARFVDLRGNAKPVLAGRGGTAAASGAEPPIFPGPGHGHAGGAVSEALVARLEDQILTNLSKTMPINLYYVAGDADCAVLADRIWNFLDENGFCRGVRTGIPMPAQPRGLHITMKAESCDMTIAPPG